MKLKMFKFTIGKKLALAFVLVIIIIAAFGFYTITKLTSETNKSESASNEANIAVKSIDPATQSITQAAAKQGDLIQKMAQVNSQIKQVQELANSIKNSQIKDAKIVKVIFLLYEMTKFNKQYVATGDGSYMSQHKIKEKEMLALIDELKPTNTDMYNKILISLKDYKKGLGKEEDALIEDNKELAMQISLTQVDIITNSIITQLNNILTQSSKELVENINKTNQLGSSAMTTVTSAGKALNDGKKIVDQANSQITSSQTQLMDSFKKVGDTTLNLKEAVKYIFGICIGVIIVCIILAIVFPAMLSKPIRLISDMVNDIAKGEGDLTKRLTVTSKDEIGDMAVGFNQFIGNLQNIIREISKVESNLSGIIEKIKVSCEGLNNGVIQQDEAVGITTKLMGEMEIGFKDASSNIASLVSAVQENSATMEQMIKSLQVSGENTMMLKDSVGAVSSSISQIGTGIQTVSANAKKLGDNVNLTATSIEQNIVTLQSITKNIQNANDNAKGMSAEAEKGDTAVTSTIKGFKEIESALGDQTYIIKSLEGKSGD